MLQLGQIPLITKFADSTTKSADNSIEGICNWCKQKVCSQILQKKWTCRSSKLHSQRSSHKANFVAPEPSSISCTKLFFSKFLIVLKIDVLSTPSNIFSMSYSRMACVCERSVSSTFSLMGVGFIFLARRIFSGSIFREFILQSFKEINLYYLTHFVKQSWNLFKLSVVWTS